MNAVTRSTARSRFSGGTSRLAIPGAQPQYVADAQAQVPLQHQGRGNPFIGPASAEPLPHGLDDLLILLGGERLRFLVHGGLHRQKFVFSG